MARSGFATTPNCLRLAAGVVTAHPCTLAIWFNTPAATSSENMLMCCSSANSANFDQFSIDLLSTGQLLARTGAAGAGSSASTTAGAYAANVWNHACGVFESPTSRAAFINGRFKATDATSRTPSGINRTSIGLRDNTSADRAFTGSLAYAAVWKIALSDGQVARIGGSNGPPIKPWLIAREHLVGLWELDGDASPEPNFVNRAQDMSIVGSLTKATSPRLVLPPPRRFMRAA